MKERIVVPRQKAIRQKRAERRAAAGAEAARLAAFADGRGFKAWGPYLSERQWGTVREDYSPHGNAWDYFPHDHARSRAYRWGEDGIAGLSDDRAALCAWRSRCGTAAIRS